MPVLASVNNMPELTRRSQTRRGHRKSSHLEQDESVNSAEVVVTSPTTPQTRNVFLYISLDAIENVPNIEEVPLKLRLNHPKSPVTNMTDPSRAQSDTIDVTHMENGSNLPTFSLTIAQDSVDVVNDNSDRPLSLVLYRTVKERIYAEGRSAGDEEDETDEIMWADHLDPIGEGFIDLLDFFKNKRSLSNTTVFLYPINTTKYDVSWPTCKTTWTVYSVMPLLKAVTVTNVVFITVESIYNPTPQLLNITEDLIIDLSLRSKSLNEAGEYDKYFIASYSMLTRSVIGQQNVNFKWESLKNEALNNLNSLSIQTGCKVNVLRLFHGVLGTEDVDFNYKQINMNEDEAIICNSVHRFVLTHEMSAMLEEVVAFDKFEIYVELYSRERPEEKLMDGIVDLQIMLYPMVNSIRFAVELRSIQPKAAPPAAGTAASKRPSKKKASNNSGFRSSKTFTPSEGEPPTAPTFIIINLCLINPITGAVSRASKIQDKAFQKERLLRCDLPIIETMYKKQSQVCEETYKSFDKTIDDMLRTMITENITQLDQAKTYFCHQLDNISNMLVKLVACDFNIRFPTKDNMEFSNLITVVYKELTQRVHDIAQKCDKDNIGSCFAAEDENVGHLFYLINLMKFLYEIGEMKLYQIVSDKLNKMYPENCVVNFSMFLFNVEKCDYVEARNYTKMPLKLKRRKGEFFAELVAMYIRYMYDTSTPERDEMATETLLRKLRFFTGRYPHDIEGWVMFNCVYSQHNYLPGMAFTRKQYESLYDSEPREMLDIPRSRWEIYNSYEIKFQRVKDVWFYRVLQLFNALGMYGFSEMLFAMIAERCTEMERHIMESTYQVLLNKVDAKTPVKSFAVDQLPQPDLAQASLLQTNGNVEFSRFAEDNAMQHYGRILNIKFTENESTSKFQLSFLRYACCMYRRGNYVQACEAFEKCCQLGGNCPIAQFNMGKALYRLDRLEEADMYLCSATKYGIYNQDLWGFLALVNLKLGRNFKALEFWKYARMKQKAIICDEVYEELAKIDKSKIDLYVDVPNDVMQVPEEPCDRTKLKAKCDPNRKKTVIEE